MAEADLRRRSAMTGLDDQVEELAELLVELVDGLPDPEEVVPLAAEATLSERLRADPKRKADPASFIFELLLLYRLLNDLMDEGFAVRVISPDPRRVVFHRSPGSKAACTRFDVSRGDLSWQVVHCVAIGGIDAEDHGDDEDAPDVALLAGDAPDDVNHSHVLSIWDAKYRKPNEGETPPTSSRPIHKGEVQGFISFLENLAVLPPGPANAIHGLSALPERFRVPALFSNGRAPTTSSRRMRTLGFSVVVGFGVDPATGPRPTEPEHVAEYQATVTKLADIGRRILLESRDTCIWAQRSLRDRIPSST